MPVGVSYQITGVAPLLARLENLSGRKLASRTARSLSTSARRVLAPAIAREAGWRYGGHAGKYPTKGLLSKRQRITARRVRTRPGEMVAISVKPRVWFEHFVVRGTKPHVISARGAGGVADNRTVRTINKGGSARALFFRGIYASQVQHPGAKPNDYVHRAAQGKEQAVLDQLSHDLAKEH